ncbi:acetylcholinesterase 1-like, partial [Contarinia nasturtii]|uniref:acetylcholinesterase 1-like n=1 Tax=Contarinia nasturtii TaxID=265458 RepID=UPI0012D43077
MHKTFIRQVPYFEFKGIPFAKPPIGNLRFKAPEPIDPWKPKTIDAFEFGNACMQDSTRNLYVSENCLYLNIFAPANANTEKLAVMVFVYGGSFVYGAAQEFGPTFLMEQNVILVTFNHRVGAFGFLSLGTREYSGNMGLKDQQLAFKWVHNNIEHFGGDNTRITIMGHSA